MVLALQAGVVSQELLDALTAVDDKLSSVRPSRLLAFAKSSLQPRHQQVPFEHTTCRSRDS